MGAVVPPQGTVVIGQPQVGIVVPPQAGVVTGQPRVGGPLITGTVVQAHAPPAQEAVVISAPVVKTAIVLGFHHKEDGATVDFGCAPKIDCFGGDDDDDFYRPNDDPPKPRSAPPGMKRTPAVGGR